MNNAADTLRFYRMMQVRFRTATRRASGLRMAEKMRDAELHYTTLLKELIKKLKEERHASYRI